MLSLILQAVAILAGLVAAWSYLKYVHKRHPNEPPVTLGSLVPFLGAALQFSKNPRQFLRDCEKQHGNVFTVLMAGKRMVFICNPHHFPSVFRRPKVLDFKEIGFDITRDIFGVSETFLKNEELEEGLIRAYQHLRGDELLQMTSRMRSKLLDYFKQPVEPTIIAPSSEWKDGGLWDVVRRSVFFAGSETVFGDGFFNPSIFDSFNLFDAKFPLLMAGIPCSALGQAETARQDQVKATAVQRKTASQYMQTRHAHLSKANAPDVERGNYQTAMLWASQANTVPAAFWSLAYLVANPRDFKRAQEAVVHHFEDNGDIDENGHPKFSHELISTIPLVESAIDEAFRLSTASMTIRRVQQDYDFQLPAVGTEVPERTYRLRKGDVVALYPELVHYDEEVYTDPESYQVDRFLTEDGKLKTKFYKNGKAVTHYLMPFGGGVSYCPGRFFARNEIRLVICVLLWYFDMKMDGELPPRDQTRAGLGILPPTKDVTFAYKLRDGVTL